MLKFREILQNQSPFDPGAGARLPGLAPLGDAPVFWRDDCFAAQMGYRDWLVQNRPELVLAQKGASAAALAEMRAFTLSHLQGYTIGAGAREIERPDGKVISFNGDLADLARLVPDDICLLEKRGSAHVLSAASLCFPASWTLSEKIGRPLAALHHTVPEYSADLARRVQRIFDGLHPEKPVWRANHLDYADPDLFQPRREAEPRIGDHSGPFRRVERQILLKLPKTGALLFIIHTFVTRPTAD